MISHSRSVLVVVAVYFVSRHQLLLFLLFGFLCCCMPSLSRALRTSSTELNWNVVTRNDVVEYLSLIFKLGNVLIGAKQEDDIKERFSAIFSDQNVNEKNGLLARDGLLARTDL